MGKKILFVGAGPTPVSAAVVEVVHEVERGQRKPDPQNIALTLRRAGV